MYKHIIPLSKRALQENKICMVALKLRNALPLQKSVAHLIKELLLKTLRVRKSNLSLVFSRNFSSILTLIDCISYQLIIIFI